jgi:hypothetical protein
VSWFRPASGWRDEGSIRKSEVLCAAVWGSKGWGEKLSWGSEATGGGADLRPVSESQLVYC